MRKGRGSWGRGEGVQGVLDDAFGAFFAGEKDFLARFGEA